jgi:6-pyruvoyltetrahydropterin/6-carboxytetrahydropterin synthase
MLITKKIEIDAGHRVFNHKSKCFSPHGHRYVIEVGIDDKLIKRPGTSSEGMVMDFGDIKEILMAEIDAKFDHSFIIYEKDYLMRYMFIDSLKITVDKELFRNTIPYYNELIKQVHNARPFKIVIVNFIPTAENLAKYWYKILRLQLQKKRIKIAYVRV